jgi:hypothetical protein
MRRQGTLHFRRPRRYHGRVIFGETACITSQSTRTHNNRRRLRRKCWRAGHLHVMPQPQCWLPRRQLRSSVVVNSSAAAGCAAILRSCNHPGPFIRFTPCPFGAAVALSTLAACKLSAKRPAHRCHRHTSLTGIVSRAGASNAEARHVALSQAAPLSWARHFWGDRLHNKSIDTDAQQQKAASPQMLARRSSSR